MNISANSILKVCLSISALILSATAFSFSVQPAHAAPTPQEFIEEGTSKIGKYQMSMAAVNDGDKVMWAVIVYDTETGISETYYDQGNLTFGPDFNISRNSPAGY
jgi:hypothetical protein